MVTTLGAKMRVKQIRLQNLRLLAEQVGGVTALASRLNRSQSQLSHLIGANPVKNIGDKFAALVEQVFGQPPGWLDQEQGTNFLGAMLISWNKIKKEANKPYALQIIHDDMENDNPGISFPRGATILVDPKYNYKNGSFVIAFNQSGPCLRQLILENNQYYLKPLNRKYPIIEIQNLEKIAGTVYQLLINFVDKV